MTKREKLQEQYEEALFALLMEDAKQAHDKQAAEMHAQTAQSDDIQLPPEMDERMLELIRQSCTPKRRVVHFPKLVSRVAVAACLALCVTTTAFAASPALRTYVLSLSTTVTEKYTEFHFLYNGQDDMPAEYADSEVQEFTIGWLPDEFLFEKEERYSDQIIYSFQTTDERHLTIDKITNATTSSAIDTEDAEISYVPIRGKSALVSEKDNYVILTWAEPENATIYCVTGENVSKDDVIKVAQNIQEQNQED